MPHESTVNPYAGEELSSRPSRSGSVASWDNGLSANNSVSHVAGADVAALTNHATNLTDLTAASFSSRLSPVTYSNKNIYFGSSAAAATAAAATAAEETPVKVAKHGSLNKPEQPSELTHYEDFDDDDEDSDESKMSNTSQTTTTTAAGPASSSSTSTATTVISSTAPATTD